MLLLLAKLRDHIAPAVMLAVLGWLYRDAPRLVPHTMKPARCGIVTVTILFLPYSIYSTLYGFPSWSPDQPVWLLIIELLAGVGTFLALCWASVVLFLDAKRMP
jgi:uncharacterized membrane protein